MWILYIKIVTYCVSYNSVCICLVSKDTLRYIPRNIHTVCALFCFVVILHKSILPVSLKMASLHEGNHGTTLEKMGKSAKKDQLSVPMEIYIYIYHQTSNISSIKSQNLNISRLVLQLSFPNALKPSVKWRMKMLSGPTADAYYICMIYKGATHIKGLTIYIIPTQNCWKIITCAILLNCSNEISCPMFHTFGRDSLRYLMPGFL